MTVLKARYVPGSVERLEETLDWLGIHFDEGPRAGGRCAPYFQVLKINHYNNNANLHSPGIAYIGVHEP